MTLGNVYWPRYTLLKIFCIYHQASHGHMEACDSHEELVLKAGTSMESLGLKRDDDERDEFLARDEDEEVESKVTA